MRENLIAALNSAGNDESQKALVRAEYRIKVRNFTDFIKTLFLSQGILANQQPISEFKSAGVQCADPRAGSSAFGGMSVTASLNSLQNDFTYTSIKQNSLYQLIDSFRGGADINIDQQLINAIPDLSRIILSRRKHPVAQ